MHRKNDRYRDTEIYQKWKPERNLDLIALFFQNFPAHQSQCWYILQNVSLGYSSGFISYKLMEKQ